MIAFIKGTIEYMTGSEVIINNNGMGYSLQVSTGTIDRLKLKQEALLFTHLYIKEEALSLYGFLSREEVSVFKLLISVSGIGPKTALSVMSLMSPSDLMLAIVSNDVAALSKAQGIGKKTAERMILELRDKTKIVEPSLGAEAGLQSSGASSEKQDSIEALIALGYSRSEALRAVLETAAEGMSAETIIKLALKKLI